MVIRGDLYNSPKYLEMSLEEYLRADADIKLRFLNQKWGNSAVDIFMSFSSLYSLFDTIFGSGELADKDAEKGKYLNAMNAMNALAANHTMFNTIMNKTFGEMWKSSSLETLTALWLKITSPYDMIDGLGNPSSDASTDNDTGIDFGDIDNGTNNGSTNNSSSQVTNIKDRKIYFLPAEKASIVAGGDFFHSDGSLNNGLNPELADNDTSNQIVEFTIDDQPVSTLEQSYDVRFNKKQVAEISKGISTLPGVAALLEINALFQKSQSFLDYLASLDNSDDNTGVINSQSASVLTGSKSTNVVIPMYETRIEMIDQDSFYGSQYFFDTVGYNSEQPVIVIGDNYFISELIRRQVNDSVGTYFSVKYNVEGVDVVKMFFDNAAEESNTGNFVIGQVLSEEQMAGLTQDIVWFVTETVDGTEVLVPRIYLASSSIEEIKVSSETGTAIISAGANVVVDATEINNVNAVITAGNHVILEAENDINNISSGMNAGISAGGSVVITSDSGDIVNNGSSISAGEHVILTAEEGSIDLIASVGRDEKGNQSIGAYEDGVSAGGSIQLVAKEINVTAVDLTADNAVILKSTEGNVNFNDIHEVTSDYDYSHEATGFMSYYNEENISITAKSKTSSVNAGGTFIVDAAQDAVFTGGDYNASAASIKADNDIITKTSQDVSYTEKNVEQSEFSFGYNYQTPWASGGNDYSTLDSVDKASTGLDSSSSASTDIGNIKYD